MAEQLICCICGKEFDKTAKGRQYCCSKECSLERNRNLAKWANKLKGKSINNGQKKSVGELTSSQNREFLARAESKEKKRIPKGKRVNGMDVISNKAAIADINNRARELGISYGEYIARYESEQVKTVRKKEEPTKAKNTSIPLLIEEMAGIVCDQLCKYRDTCDENCECDMIREHGDCPISKYY